MTDVLFVGLGAMGAPIAANLARSRSVELTVFDTAPHAASAREIGRRRAADLRDGVTDGGIVFLCLPDISQVEAVCADLLAVDARPRCVVDLSTSEPERTRVLAATLAESGIAMLDAPVARGRAAAATGELLMMVGGPADAFAELAPLLGVIASDVLHCGDAGSGQTVKILNNMVLLMNVHALTEAIAVAEHQGLDIPTVVRVLRQGSAGSFALSGDPGQALESAEFPRGKFAVDYALKDIELAERLAGDLPLPALHAAADLLARASESGYGEDYYPATVQVVLGRRLQGDYRTPQEHA